MARALGQVGWARDVGRPGRLTRYSVRGFAGAVASSSRGEDFESGISGVQRLPSFNYLLTDVDHGRRPVPFRALTDGLQTTVLIVMSLVAAVR